MTKKRSRGLRRGPTLLAAMLLVSLSTGCTLLSARFDDRPEELAEARARWRAVDLEGYVWRVDRTCYCAAFGRAEIRVEDGEKVSVVRVGPGQPLRQEEKRWFPTVDELFEVVEEAIGEAYRLEVEYDAVTGAPRLVDIDWVGNAIDDEVRYTATRPTPLQ